MTDFDPDEFDCEICHEPITYDAEDKVWYHVNGDWDNHDATPADDDDA